MTIDYRQTHPLRRCLCFLFGAGCLQRDLIAIRRDEQRNQCWRNLRPMHLTISVANPLTGTTTVGSIYHGRGGGLYHAAVSFWKKRNMWPIWNEVLIILVDGWSALTRANHGSRIGFCIRLSYWKPNCLRTLYQGFSFISAAWKDKGKLKKTSSIDKGNLNHRKVSASRRWIRRRPWSDCSSRHYLCIRERIGYHWHKRGIWCDWQVPSNEQTEISSSDPKDASRKSLYAFLLRMKQPDGSFTMHTGGEIDIR